MMRCLSVNYLERRMKMSVTSGAGKRGRVRERGNESCVSYRGNNQRCVDSLLDLPLRRESLIVIAELGERRSLNVTMLLL